MNVSQAIPDNIEHFQQAEPKHYFDYKNWRLKILHLATIFPQLVAKRRPNDFFNFEPCVIEFLRKSYYNAEALNKV